MTDPAPRDPVLRADHGAEELRRIARAVEDRRLRGRFLALAALYDGFSPAEAARHWGVSEREIRRCVTRFNAGGPEALADPRPPAQP